MPSPCLSSSPFHPLSFSLPLRDIPIAKNPGLLSDIILFFFFLFSFPQCHRSFVPTLSLPPKSTFSFFLSLFLFHAGVELQGVIAGDSRASPTSQLPHPPSSRPHPHRYLKCSRGADSNMSPQLSFSRRAEGDLVVNALEFLFDWLLVHYGWWSVPLKGLVWGHYMSDGVDFLGVSCYSVLSRILRQKHWLHIRLGAAENKFTTLGADGVWWILLNHQM